MSFLFSFSLCTKITNTEMKMNKNYICIFKKIMQMTNATKLLNQTQLKMKQSIK